MRLTLALLFSCFYLWGMDISKERSTRIVNIFNKLRADNVEILDNFYHPQITFEDPLGQVKSLANMKTYYQNMYESVEDIKFDFTNEVIQGDQHFVEWDMHLTAPKLNGGKSYTTQGSSIIKFDPETNKVIRHRDYFDMSGFLYEQLPVLKYLINAIKKPLQHQP